MAQMNLLTKQKETHRLRKQTDGCLGGGGGEWGRDREGVWEGHVHTALFEMDNL